MTDLSDRLSTNHAEIISFTRSIDLFIFIELSDTNIFPSNAVGAGTFLD